MNLTPNGPYAGFHYGRVAFWVSPLRSTPIRKGYTRKECENPYKTSTYTLNTHTVRECKAVRIGVFAQPRPYSAHGIGNTNPRVTSADVRNGTGNTYTRAPMRTPGGCYTPCEGDSVGPATLAPWRVAGGLYLAPWASGASQPAGRPDGAVTGWDGGAR